MTKTEIKENRKANNKATMSEDGPKSTRAGVALPRRSFISDMPDRGLFLVIAVVGFSAILYFKTRVFDSETIAAGAVVAMILYGWIAYMIPTVHMRLDRLGDNFYYLGFIYTLASLSAALLQLRAGADDFNAILGSFGIALITTIVGIAGRVIFVQMRSEFDDAEPKVRQEILEAASSLKAQLLASVSEFEIYRAAVKQAVEEQIKTDLGRPTAAAEDQIERIRKLAENAADRMDKAFNAYDSQVGRLKTIFDRLIETTENAFGRLGELELPLDEYRAKLQKFVEELDYYAGVMGQIVDSAKRSSAPRERRRWWKPWRSRPGRERA